MKNKNRGKKESNEKIPTHYTKLNLAHKYIQ
jgi:hypothetical protein